jgi:hypothetical protein
MQGFIDTGVQITAALAANGYIRLDSSNVSNPNQATSSSYRTTTPILLPRFGGLFGNNAYIFASSWDGTAKPIVGWQDNTIGGLGEVGRIYLSGIRAMGDRREASRIVTNEFITGFEFLGRNTANGRYEYTHSKVMGNDLNANRCYVGFSMGAIQYATHENYTAHDCVIGFRWGGFASAGAGDGNIDWPTVTNMNALGCGVGHLLSAGTFGPFGEESRLIGSWAKFCLIGYAAFWDPDDTTPLFADNYGAVIDGGTTEFNGAQNSNNNPNSGLYLEGAGAGVQGDAARFSLAVQRPNGTSYTLSIPKTEVAIEKNFRLTHRGYTFHTNDTAINTIVMSTGAIWRAENTTIPAVAKYACRALHRLSGCELTTLDSIGQSVQIWENVRRWPDEVTRIIGSYTGNQHNGATVLCGWGGMEQGARAADWLSELNAASFPNRIQPPWTNSTGNVTTGTDTDPETGETVSYFDFPATTLPNSFAISPWLGGGASAKSYSGQFDWALTQIELRNTHSTAVRLMPHLRDAANFALGCNPANSGATVPEAVTLWPNEWMRVSILWMRPIDYRLAFGILSPTNTSLRVLSRKVANFKVPAMQRQRLNKALQRGIFV